MCTSWEAGGHIQKVDLGVKDELYIHGVVLLAVEIWERIWRGCFNVHVRAVYCTDCVG